MNDNTVLIRILDRQFEVKCPAEQEMELHEAAMHLDRKMQEISERGRLKNNEQIAIMAALNISHELTQAKSQLKNIDTTVDARVRTLNQKVEATLKNQTPESHQEEFF